METIAEIIVEGEVVPAEIAMIEEEPVLENTLSTETAMVVLSDAEKAAIALDLKLKLERIIFAADQPLTIKQIRAVFPDVEVPSVDEVRQAITQLQEDYAERAVHLVEVASGFCFRATALIAPYVGN